VKRVFVDSGGWFAHLVAEDVSHGMAHELSGAPFEIDGGYHAEQGDADARRQRALGRAGYRVVRLDGERVMRDRDAAVAQVRAVIAELCG
jgi:Protein of unknown function (DUF559)